MQLYTPPELMINKDFLKQILAEEKEFMEVDAVKKVNMPKYDELSVKNFWPRVQGNLRIMKFFPDKLPKGRQPDHEFFWNVFNTLEEPYVRQLLAHANEQRNSAQAEGQQLQSIVVSTVMANKLLQFPFQPSKLMKPN